MPSSSFNPRLLSLALATVATLGVTACSDDDGNGPSTAGRPVALLIAPSVVDFDSTETSSEASEMYHTLASLGARVTFVEQLDSAALHTALNDKVAFVIPEATSTTWVGTLTPGAKIVLRQFVADGGTLVAVPSIGNRVLLDTLFDYALQGASYDINYARQDTAAAGSVFAGGADRLWDNDGMYTLARATLPTGARAIYASENNVVMAYVPRERGHVVLLGWDWYNAAPFGSQDGGWIDVLRRALLL